MNGQEPYGAVPTARHVFYPKGLTTAMCAAIAPHNLYIAICVVDVRVLHMLVETCMSGTQIIPGSYQRNLTEGLGNFTPGQSVTVVSLFLNASVLHSSCNPLKPEIRHLPVI